MEYANVIYKSINEAELLDNVQYEAARVVSGAMRGTGKARVLRKLAWEQLETKRCIHSEFGVSFESFVMMDHKKIKA